MTGNDLKICELSKVIEFLTAAKRHIPESCAEIKKPLQEALIAAGKELAYSLEKENCELKK